MLDKIHGEEELLALVGEPLYDVWKKLCALFDDFIRMLGIKRKPNKK